MNYEWLPNSSSEQRKKDNCVSYYNEACFENKLFRKKSMYISLLAFLYY